MKDQLQLSSRHNEGPIATVESINIQDTDDRPSLQSEWRQNTQTDGKGDNWWQDITTKLKGFFWYENWYSKFFGFLLLIYFRLIYR